MVDGLATSIQIKYPTSLLFDRSGRLIFGDSQFHSYRRLDFSTNLVETIAENGSPGYSGDGGLATADTMRYTGAACLDHNDNLLLPDTENTVLRRVDASTLLETTPPLLE